MKTRLNPRDPFVIDVHDLSRRPGTMREIARTVPAPVDMGTAVIGVPQGSDMDLDLRLESVMEGVLVTGPVSASTVGECVRCLERVDQHVVAHLAELFVYPERAEAARAEGDEEEVYEIEDELIDLEPALRDAVVTALPFQPVCAEDCRGLCSECGARLSDPGNENHAHEILDPRWAALQALSDADGEDGAGDRA